MKRSLLLLSVLCLSLVLAAPVIADNKPIKFGIMGPMGDATGLNVLRPAELMINKINADGGILGRKIEIVGPYDTKWQPAEGIRAFERLKAAGVDVILSGIVDDSEAGLLSRIAATDDILYFFRVCFYNDLYGKCQGKIQKIQKLLYVYADRSRPVLVCRGAGVDVKQTVRLEKCLYDEGRFGLDGRYRRNGLERNADAWLECGGV